MFRTILHAVNIEINVSKGGGCHHNVMRIVLIFHGLNPFAGLLVLDRLKGERCLEDSQKTNNR
jgi:hypothetical protein